jgi:hypothetical protein
MWTILHYFGLWRFLNQSKAIGLATFIENLLSEKRICFSDMKPVCSNRAYGKLATEKASRAKGALLALGV